MTKYEYKVLVLQTGTFRQNKAVEDWIKELNKLGKEGWELVAVIPMVAQLGFAGATPQARCFLKRKI
jgi:glycosyltransferase involved in cell wall biosynthesis